MPITKISSEFSPNNCLRSIDGSIKLLRRVRSIPLYMQIAFFFGALYATRPAFEFPMTTSENGNVILARSHDLLKIFLLTGESTTIPFANFIARSLQIGSTYIAVMLSQQCTISGLKCLHIRYTLEKIDRSLF